MYSLFIFYFMYVCGMKKLNYLCLLLCVYVYVYMYV